MINAQENNADILLSQLPVQSPLLQRSLSITLPQSAKNPVDVYIASLSSLRSVSTMWNALRSTVRAMAEEGWTALDPKAITNDTVRGIGWHRLDKSAMDGIRGLLIRRHEPAGALLRMNAVRGVLRKAWDAELIDTEAYMRAIKTDAIPVHQSDVGRSLSKEEIGKLLDACAASDHFTAARDAALLAVMIFAGLRREEATNLDVSDYDADEASLRIRHGKGNKKRTTYLCSDGLDILNAWLDVRATKAKPSMKQLFLTYHNGGRLIRSNRMSPEMANVIVRKAQLAAGITSLTPHDCRRTFATLLFEAGADLLLVQSLMGHASADTTKRYDKRQESHKREAAQLLNLKGVS